MHACMHIWEGLISIDCLLGLRERGRGVKKERKKTMEDSVIDPHDKMRSRDVNKVATGEQAPRPPHEPGSISQAPPPSDHVLIKVEELKTAPYDARFPFTNQTRHCYARFIEYHQCTRAKGGNAPECDKFASYYRSLCPSEWIESWNEQLELGVFPGPL